MTVTPVRAVLLLLGAAVLTHGVLLRPRLVRWGATVTEEGAPLPGDELVERPTHVTTRAITIAAPARAIWPWLRQMGQDRAGFYSHNWVERLLWSGIPDVHELHPEWQVLHAGDLVRTNRELRPGHPLGWVVALIVPDRLLVLRSRNLPAGTYSYVLEPLPGDATRLLLRDRMVWRWWQAPFRLLVFEPLHAYMQTGQLEGIKGRAERRGGAIREAAPIAVKVASE